MATFTCAKCGGTFESDQSGANMRLEKCTAICQGCFEQLRPVLTDQEMQNALLFIQRGHEMIARYPEHREFFEEVIADVKADIARSRAALAAEDATAES